MPRTARSTAATTGGTTAISNGNPTVIGSHAALDSVQQLRQTIDQLEHELKVYADPNVVGRDTLLLRSFFDQSVARIMQIAMACKVPWRPGTTTGNRR